MPVLRPNATLLRKLCLKFRRILEHQEKSFIQEKVLIEERLSSFGIILKLNLKTWALLWTVSAPQTYAVDSWGNALQAQSLQGVAKSIALRDRRICPLHNPT